MSAITHARYRVARICIPAGWLWWWRLFVTQWVPKRKPGRPLLEVVDSGSAECLAGKTGPSKLVVRTSLGGVRPCGARAERRLGVLPLAPPFPSQTIREPLKLSPAARRSIIFRVETPTVSTVRSYANDVGILMHA